jgi:competence protein ComEC
MGRSAWLAIGAVAAAIAIEPLGTNVVGAFVALAMAALLVFGELGPRGGVRRAWPVVIGAGLIAVRLAFLPAGPAALQTPPDGDGPWTLTVLTTGSPRDGHQTATLGTPPDTSPGFTVAATLPRYPLVIPGDRIRVDGPIRSRPESPYGEYLARIGAAGTLTSRSLEIEPAPADPWRRLEELRRGAAEALAGVLPEPEAGLAAGILIGLRDRVDRELSAAFTTAGVSHVVAISGWNIAIVAAAIATLAGGLGRRRRSVVTIVAIVAYVCFAGASPSVVRAAMMAGVVLLARESGRAGRAAAALGWAATLLLISDPELIRDAGFQLSSLATAGLIAWATPVTEWIDRVGRGRVPRWLGESLGVSLAAQAATLPIVLVSFGRLAILSPLVNLAVVPLVAPAMAVGLIALAAGIAVQAGAPAAVGAILAAPGWVILRILVAIVQIAAGLPFASLTLEPPLDSVAAATSVAGLATLVWWRRRRSARHPDAIPPAVLSGAKATGAPRSDKREHGGPARRGATIGLVIAVVVAGGVVAARPRGSASVAILDVGQGDAILIEGSRGGRLLVDGGPDPDRLLVALDRRIPPWDRRIDSVILSHPHEDHVAGLALLLERYHVDRVMEPGMRGPGPGYAAWLAKVADADGPVRLAIAAGDRLAVDEIELQVLWPARGRVPLEPPDGGTGINNVSVVLAGQVGNWRFLLMGDVEEEIDPELLAGGLHPVDLLKVAHHGSRTATTQAFVDAVRPRIAVASAGAGNSYGHPTKATMERLVGVGARVLRTDRDGTVVVGFGMDGMTVRSEGARRLPPRPSRPPTAALESASSAFRCAIPVTALVPEREAASVPSGDPGWRGVGARNDGPSSASTVEYHRIDDRSRAGGGRLPPAVPGSPTLVRAARSRGRGSRGMACGTDRWPWGEGRPPPGRGSSAPPRRRQGLARWRSPARAPPRRRFRSLAHRGRSLGARTFRGEPPGDAPARWRAVPPLGRLRFTRGADRGVRRQTGRSAAGVDGRSLRVVAATLSAVGIGTRRSVGRRDVHRGPTASRPA